MANVTKKSWMRFVYRQEWNSAAPLWIIALVLGLIQTWANRFYMGNDGVSYLDMADAYLRGNWHTALNSSWNPLYSWLIGLDFLVFRPSPYWEYPMVQVLNFGIYVVALASFEYFLRGWLACRRVDELAVRVIAYGLFLWSSLFLIGLWTVNGDMLVAVFLYAALGLLVRAHNAKTATVLTSAILGITLAGGYYSKAVMFPVSIVLLLIASIVLRWQRALIAALVFGALCVPLIIGLSKVTGHLTFGDTGRVNYAWYVNGVAFRWWQGGPASSGQPQHPPQILIDSPRVYEFGGVFPEATYPIWYDFSYWYKGLRVWFDRHRQESVIRANLKWTLKLLIWQGGGFWLGWGVCFLLYKNKTGILNDLVATWPFWGVSIAVILLYCAVHIETRYIGAFVTVLLLSAYTALRVPGKRIAAGIVAVGLLWAIVNAARPTLGARYLPGKSTGTNISWQVATDLQKLGLHANDKVASVCYSNRKNVLWARLTRAHIVAETDWDVDFWRLSDVDQNRVLAALARSGALMAVSDEPPPDPARAVGWRQAGSTNYYAYLLSQSVKPVQSSAILTGAGRSDGARSESR